MSDGFSIPSVYSFTLDVIITSPITVNTGPPHFLGFEVLPPVQLEVGQSLRIKLPQVIDDDGDTYSVSIPNFVASGIYLFTEWNKN